MKGFVLLLTLLTIIPSFSLSYAQSIIPRAEETVLIDGFFDGDEWADAVVLPLSGGKGVFVKADESFLYIAVSGAKGGFASICLNREDSILVLHSSTKLITAEYVRESFSWRLSEPFSSLPGAVRSMPVDEAFQLEKFSWTANVVEQGPPEQTEFKIDRKLFGEDAVVFSVVFFQFRADMQLARAPAQLDDGCLDRELVMGGNREILIFEPDTWIHLSF